MQMFSYRAVDLSGRVTSGQLPALSMRELESRLMNSGLEVIAAKAVSAQRWLPGGGIPIKELINFCFHMEQTLRAGILMTEALNDMTEGTNNRRMRDTMLVVLEAVRGGQSLSEAMSQFPQIFDQVFIGLIRSGEQSGRLADMFAKLGDSLKWQDELQSQIKKLMMYPAFMIVVLVGVTLFVLLYLVPQMASFIRATGNVLPLQTRILLFASEVMVVWWKVIIGALIATPIAFFIGLKVFGERLAFQIDFIKLKLPLFGPVLEKVIIARFSSLFGMLYESGVPILQSTQICRDAIGNKALERAVEKVESEINQGRSIAQAFEAAKLFPSLMVRMIKIGEATGEIDKALANVSYFYNREVKEKIDKVQAMIEPMMTLILGGILGWLMMAVLGPMYDLIAKIKF